MGGNRGSMGGAGGPRKFGGGGGTGGGGPRFGGGGSMGGGMNRGGPQRGGPPRGGMGQRSQNSNNAGSNLRKPNWDHESLRPFKKDFYVPHPNVCNRHPREVSDFREMHKITLKGDRVPNPIQFFEEGNFPDYVMQGKLPHFYYSVE